MYEEEADLFFEDLSTQVIQDDVFARILTFPNVVVTAHQAFFTRQALEAIAQEIVRAAARSDISEEVTRFRAHLETFSAKVEARPIHIHVRDFCRVQTQVLQDELGIRQEAAPA